MYDTLTDIKFTKQSYKDFKRKVLQQLGFVNQELRRKQDLELTLKRCGITHMDLDLIGWGYKEESNQMGKLKEITFEDIIELGLGAETEIPEVQEIKAIERVDKVVEDIVNVNPVNPVNNKEQLEGLINNYALIMQMVEQFKTYGMDAIEGKKNIVIELPNEDDKSFKATYRINKAIHEQFKEFCNEKKEYTSKDLISMALKEYIEKYKDS